MNRFRDWLKCFSPAVPWLITAGLIVAVLLILVSALRPKAHAQFGGVQQPMFGMLSTPSGYVDPSGMGYLSNWWYWADMSTNAFAVSSGWTDRISGVIFTNGAYDAPTNYALGVYFTSTAGLFRDSSVSNNFPLSDNSSMVCIWKRNSTTAFATLLWHSSGAWKIRRNGAWVAGVTASEVDAFDEPDDKQFQDLIVIRDNTAGKVTIYTNGVISAYDQTTSQLIRPDIFGARGDAFDRGAESYIREVLYYPTNLDATAISNIHYYTTNTHTLTYLFADWDASKLTANDGDAISIFTDQSASAYHMLSSGADRPYWTNSVSVLNNKGFLVFDGVANYMRTNFTPISQPVTWYLVAKSISGANIAYFASAIAGAAHTMYSIGGNHAMSGGSAQTVGADPSSSWYIFTIVFNGASSMIKTNHVQLGSTVSIGVNGPSGITLGAFAAGSSGWSPVQVARMIGYNIIHTDTQQSNIVNNLNTIYSVY